MTTIASHPIPVRPDSAAVFACAISLWRACHERAAADAEWNLSARFDGNDQLMREVMAVGTRFEAWACRHICFEDLCDVWPYLLEDRFGDACLACLLPEAMAEFRAEDCLLIALHLRLPVRLTDALPIPFDRTAPNPVARSGFRELAIQTVRDSLRDGETRPYVVDDNPFDEAYGAPYFAIYGVAADGLREHLADRGTYDEAFRLVQNLAPGIPFPESPSFQVAAR